MMTNKYVLENPMRSLWLKDGLSVHLTPLQENQKTGAVVVGAGITGITTAYLLHKQGVKVILIDRKDPLSLATGNTTAKFSFQHGLIFQQIVDNYGADQAKWFYKSQLDGMNFVKNIIRDHGINCDFKETFACVYAEDEKDIDALKKEQQSYDKIDIKSELVYEDPLNLGYHAALKVPNQFELNPVKYLEALMKYLQEQNVPIYNNTAAVDFSGEGPYTVKTKQGYEITADHVIVATGYPVFDAGSKYYSRLEPLRSYITAFKNENGPTMEGMYITIDETAPYSLRFSATDNQRYLLVGGQGHKVGQRKSEREDYNTLINFASKYFNVKDAAYRWSAQDYRTLDKIPFIGEISSDYPNMYVGTGYNKWGMASGSFAALLITSLIAGKANTTMDRIKDEDKEPYQKLFDPSRKEISSNLGSFVKQNINVGKEMLKSKFTSSKLNVSDLLPNQGAILKKEGNKVAAFKDSSGKVHIHSATCTHMGCDLEYNDGERTFDCPCHGSRFHPTGEPVEGPAVEDLKKKEE